MATKLYRTMRSTPDGNPVCGPTARTLGARVPEDISPDEAGRVHPTTGGMSVSPDDPRFLPRHRRPAHLNFGTGKDPLWEIGEDHVGVGIVYRPDPMNPNEHGFVEPAVAVAIELYQKALCDTTPRWRRR